MSEPSGRPRRGLVIANRLPYPLDDGWKVRTFHMVRSVAQLADTTLLVFHPGEDAAMLAAREALGPRVRIVHCPPPRPYTISSLVRGLVTGIPVHIWNQESPALYAALDALQAEGRFDFCVAESTFVYRYVERLDRATLRVIDTHNIDSVTMRRYATTLSSWPRRLYAQVTAKKVGAFESRVFADSDLVWVCSSTERDLVRRMSPGTDVEVVPNGVDTGWMTPAPRANEVPNRLVFFGRMDYFPNVDGLAWFARDVLPLIRARIPAAELQVLGPAATDAVRAIAAGDPSIVLLGRVDDVRPVLESAAVVVVPLRAGGGTRLKIVEALSMARPVVSTAIGAEGLDLAGGDEIVLADSPEDFAARVVDLLRNEDARRRLGAAGRSAVQAGGASATWPVPDWYGPSRRAARGRGRSRTAAGCTAWRPGSRCRPPRRRRRGLPTDDIVPARSPDTRTRSPRRAAC
jgi:glycosyltransferase involved in cell wall biosynthesis